MRILPATCLAQGEVLWMRGQQFVKSREKTTNSREKIIAQLAELGPKRAGEAVNNIRKFAVGTIPARCCLPYVKIMYICSVMHGNA